MVYREWGAGPLRSWAISAALNISWHDLGVRLHGLLAICMVLRSAGENGVTENGWGQTENELLFGDGGYCVADDVAKFQ